MAADDKKAYSGPGAPSSPAPEGGGPPHEERPAPEAAAAEPSGETEAEPLEARVERLARELEAKAAEAADYRDRYLRERAELENFKKRMQREQAEALRYATESLIRDLLPVIDDLERALGYAEAGGDGRPLVEGVRLVVKKALEVLERHGVSRVEAAGEPFDPSRHEAIERVPDAEREPNRVVQQFLPGYFLHDRLLRPAQVSVSTKPSVENPPEDD